MVLEGNDFVFFREDSKIRSYLNAAGRDEEGAVMNRLNFSD